MRKFASLMFLLVMFVTLEGCSNGIQPFDNTMVSSTFEATLDSTISDTPVEKEENPNFRQVTWGMTKDEVKKYEGEPSSEEPNSLTYHNIQFNNYNTTLFYTFNSKGQLCDAGYAVSELYTDMNQYINDYDSWKEVLVSRYGTPTIDGPKWTTDAYETDRNKYGTAIVRGDLAMVAFWATPTTSICEGLCGVDNDIVLSVSFVSTTIQKDN